MKKLLLTGIAALFLATGTARAADPFNCGPRQIENVAAGWVELAEQMERMDRERLLFDHEK